MVDVVYRWRAECAIPIHEELEVISEGAEAVDLVILRDEVGAIGGGMVYEAVAVGEEMRPVLVVSAQAEAWYIFSGQEGRTNGDGQSGRLDLGVPK